MILITVMTYLVRLTFVTPCCIVDLYLEYTHLCLDHRTGGLIQDFRHMEQSAFHQYLIFFNSETCVLPHWSWGTPEM